MGHGTNGSGRSGSGIEGRREVDWDVGAVSKKIEDMVRRRRERADAPDIAQEVLLVLWQRGEELGIPSDKVVAYACTMVRNRVIDAFRQDARRAIDGVDPTELAAGAGDARGASAAVTLKEVLAFLTPGELAILDDQDDEQLAASLGISKGHLHRKRWLVREKLRARWPDGWAG